MKREIAEKISQMAVKAAYKSVGESSRIGVYEVKPPEELLKRIRDAKK